MKVVKYPVGSLVKAKYSGDNQWYLATVAHVNVDKQLYSVKVGAQRPVSGSNIHFQGLIVCGVWKFGNSHS